MKNWLKDKTTWFGFALMIIAVIQAYKTGVDMVTAALGAASIACFVLKDRKQQ